MKRSTKYTLKYTTQKKRTLINQLFDLYGTYLQKTVDLLWNDKTPVMKYISTKQITWMDNLGGQYKQLIYTHASEIVRGCKSRKGKKSKPIVKNFSIVLSSNQIQVELPNKSKEFDKWIKLKLPFIKEGYKNRRTEVLVPIKEYKHSLKYKDWNQCNSIRLSKNYVSFIFEKEAPEIKKDGKTIGIDLGYKNLVVTSEGQFIGKEFDKMYEKISRKRQGSKGFIRTLKERDNEINRLINKELELDEIKILKAENLKNLKKSIKGRFRKSFNNKFQRFVYSQVLRKLERLCEENRILFTLVDPAYTSQTCPVCQFRHKDNRCLESFNCLNCGYTDHSDVVGAINISRQEFIVPVTQGVRS